MRSASRVLVSLVGPLQGLPHSLPVNAMPRERLHSPEQPPTGAHSPQAPRTQSCGTHGWHSGNSPQSRHCCSNPRHLASGTCGTSAASDSASEPSGTNWQHSASVHVGPAHAVGSSCRGRSTYPLPQAAGGQYALQLPAGSSAPALRTKAARKDVCKLTPLTNVPAASMA